MLKHFNHTLTKWGAQKVKLFAPLPSLLGDIIVLYYINTVFLEKLKSPIYINHYIHQMKNLGMLHQFADLEMFKQLYLVSLNSIGAILCLIFCVNIIIYLFCLSKYKWPRTYIKGYAFSAVFLSIFELGMYILKGDGINFYTLSSAILYFFTYYIYKFFRKTSEL